MNRIYPSSGAHAAGFIHTRINSFYFIQVVNSLEKSHRRIDTTVRPPTEAIGADCGRKTRHRKVDGGGIVQEGPGAPRSFQIQSCDGRPLAAFQY